MNQTSPAATGTAGVAIAGLVAVIATISDHFKLGISAQDQVSIASGIVVTVHWAAQQLAARRGAPLKAIPSDAATGVSGGGGGASPRAGAATTVTAGAAYPVEVVTSPTAPTQ